MSGALWNDTLRKTPPFLLYRVPIQNVEAEPIDEEMSQTPNYGIVLCITHLCSKSSKPWQTMKTTTQQWELKFAGSQSAVNGTGLAPAAIKIITGQAGPHMSVCVVVVWYSMQWGTIANFRKLEKKKSEVYMCIRAWMYVSVCVYVHTAACWYAEFNFHEFFYQLWIKNISKQKICTKGIVFLFLSLFSNHKV